VKNASTVINRRKRPGMNAVSKLFGTITSQFGIRRNVFDLTPFYNLCDGCIVLKSGEMSVVYEVLTSGGYDSLSTDNRDGIQAMFTNLLSGGLPAGSNLQIIYDFDWYQYNKDEIFPKHDLVCRLHRDREASLARMRFLMQRTFVVLTIPAYKVDENGVQKNLHRRNSQRPALLLSFMKAFSPETEESWIDYYEYNLEKLNVEKAKLEKLFDDMGVAYSQNNDWQNFKLLYEKINLSPYSLPEEGEVPLSPFAINTELISQDYKNSKNFMIGDTHVKLISMNILPETTDSWTMVGGRIKSFISPLLYDIKQPHSVVVNIELAPQAAMLSKLETQKRLGSAMKDKHQASLVKYEEAVECIDEMHRSYKHVGYFSVTTIMWNTDLKQLNNDAVSVAMNQYRLIGGMTGHVTDFDSMPLYLTCLPGMGLHNFNKVLAKIENATAFIDVTRTYKGPNSGIRFLTTEGEPVAWNYWDSRLDAWNSLVIGQTGSGKSYTVQYLIMQALEADTKLFILDLGGSYEKLVSLLGGQVFTFNLNNPVPINPFYTSQLNPENGTIPMEKMNFLITFLSGLMIDVGDDVKKIDSVLKFHIQETVKSIYKKTYTRFVSLLELVGEDAFYKHGGFDKFNTKSDKEKVLFIEELLHTEQSNTRKKVMSKLKHNEKLIVLSGEKGLRVFIDPLKKSVFVYREILDQIPLMEDFSAAWEARKEHVDDRDKEILPFEKYSARLRARLGSDTFAGFFNTPGTIDLQGGANSDYLYFDLKGLETDPELQAFVAMNIYVMLWEYIDDPRMRMFKKLVVADEVWKMLQDKSLGLDDLIKELYRTIRKMGGGVMTVSQTAEDFMEESIRRAILTNVHTKILLRHDSDNMKAVDAVFALPPEKRALLSSISKRGVVFIDRPYETVLLETCNTLMEHFIYTSNKDENNMLFKAREAAGGNLIQAIEDVAMREEERRGE